jgi:hypothetical protein
MESTTNVVVGYVVAFLSQVAVFPIVGVTASLGQNAQIGAYFTVISLARSYAIRRWFNASVEA